MSAGVLRHALEWTAPGEPRIVAEEIGPPGPGEFLVEAEWGAVSAGSERVVASGRLPGELSLDDSFGGGARFPLRYGYSLVGRVIAAGDDIDRERWLGRRVFAFEPHATHALVAAEAVKPVPDALDPRTATLYPNTETALTLLWDGAPRYGEAALVVGLGLVGVLTARLLCGVAGFVVAVEPDERRRRWAVEVLPELRIAASVPEALELLRGYDGAAPHRRYRGFDLVYELSGRAPVLEEAIGAAAFGGRVVPGSWYGSDRSELALGGRFHRSRVTIVPSQVSTIPPELAARFDYERRSAIVWDLLRRFDWTSLPRRDVRFDALDRELCALVAGENAEPWIMVQYGMETTEDNDE